MHDSPDDALETRPSLLLRVRDLVRVFDDEWFQHDARYDRQRGPLLREALDLYQALLAAEKDDPKLARRAANSAYRAARLAFALAEGEPGLRHCQHIVAEALELHRRPEADASDGDGLASQITALLQLRGSVESALGDYDTADASLREARQRVIEETSPAAARQWISNTGSLGNLAHLRGDLPLARQYYREALEPWLVAANLVEELRRSTGSDSDWRSPTGGRIGPTWPARLC